MFSNISESILFHPLHYPLSLGQIGFVVVSFPMAAAVRLFNADEAVLVFSSDSTNWS